MSPLPLLLLAAWTAFAGEPSAPAAKPVARPVEWYMRPSESASHDGALAVKDMQKFLLAGDGASIGGANHAAEVAAGTCFGHAGQCLVLAEQIRDLLELHGEKASPHLFALADKVIGGAAGKYRRIGALDEAVWKSAVPGGYGRKWTKREASGAVAGIIKHALASKRPISGTLAGPEKTVAALGARWAGEFEDAGAWFEADLKARLVSKDPEVLSAVIKTLGERVRNADTAARLLGLFNEKRQGKRELDEALQIRALQSLRMTVWTLWPMGHDKNLDSVWTDAAREAGGRYFTFACGFLKDAGCVDEDYKSKGTPGALCASAQELLIFSPKPHKATCARKSGEPPGPKCK